MRAPSRVRPQPSGHDRSGPGAAGYLAAAALAVPVAAVLWFEAVYLIFGLTGEDSSAAVHTATGVGALGLAVGWPLYRAHRPAQVVRRSCRLGILVALLLPVFAVAVLLLWQNASGRRDLGMGGLMLFSLPFVALALAVVLTILFWLVDWFAARRLVAG